MDSLDRRTRLDEPRPVPSPTLIAHRLRATIVQAPGEAAPMAFAPLTTRQACIVEVWAGNWHGVGESWINFPPWAGQERIATLCDGVAPLLLGTDVCDPAATHDRLVAALQRIGRQAGAQGPIWQALSGVDQALWDLVSQANNRSIAESLTPRPARRSVPAYGSGVGPTSVVELCERAATLGLRAVKLKVGFGRERDGATLAAADRATQLGLQIFADANQAWTLAEAIEHCKMLADHGVRWVEEPIAGDALDDLEALHSATGMPLATGENLYGAAQFAPYTGSTAIAGIQPDVSKSGGFTVARQVASSARRTGTAVRPHCYSSGLGLAATLQFAASCPEVDWVEMDVRSNPLRTDLLVNPPQLDRGELIVDHRPGAPMELDEQSLTRYRTSTSERNIQ